MKIFRKYKKIVIPAVIVVVMVSVIFVTSQQKNMSVVQDVAGTVTTPVTGFFNNIFGGVGSFVANIFGGGVSELDTLKAENTELQRENAALNENSEEVKRLKELLNFKENNPSYQYIGAKVTVKSQDYWFDTFTIGAGKTAGIEVGMAVVSNKGLVGKVSEVGATWSKVISIIDTKNSVSAIVERTRDQGTVKGVINTSSNTCELTMEHLPIDTNIQPGDKIVSSGLGSIYPKGIVIGEVIEVEQQSKESKKVRIKPVTDFLRLEEVMVVKVINSAPVITPTVTNTPVITPDPTATAAPLTPNTPTPTPSATTPVQ